jgi:hypothetical protein
MDVRERGREGDRTCVVVDDVDVPNPCRARPGAGRARSVEASSPIEGT